MANKKASNRYKAPQRNNPTRKFRVWKVPGIKFSNFEKVDFLIIFWPKKYPFSKLEEEVWGRRGPLELELSGQTWSKDVILWRKNYIWRVYSPKLSLEKFTFFLNRYFVLYFPPSGICVIYGNILPISASTSLPSRRPLIEKTKADILYVCFMSGTYWILLWDIGQVPRKNS